MIETISISQIGGGSIRVFVKIRGLRTPPPLKTIMRNAVKSYQPNQY
jgi:hypothetical protein